MLAPVATSTSSTRVARASGVSVRTSSATCRPSGEMPRSRSFGWPATRRTWPSRPTRKSAGEPVGSSPERPARPRHRRSAATRRRSPHTGTRQVGGLSKRNGEPMKTSSPFGPSTPITAHSSLPGRQRRFVRGCCGEEGDHASSPTPWPSLRRDTNISPSATTTPPTRYPGTHQQPVRFSRRRWSRGRRRSSRRRRPPPAARRPSPPCGRSRCSPSSSPRGRGSGRPRRPRRPRRPPS